MFVVHQIVQRRAAKLVLTLRDGEQVPPGLDELRSGGELARLDLQPLSRAETAALLAAALDGPIDPDATQRLWSLTRGNVLYLPNIVDQEVSSGRLARSRGVRAWAGDTAIPPSLVELIESRMRGLPSAAADVVDTLAVGEPLDLTSLRNIADPAGIEEAEVRGLITLKSVEVRLPHPLYGEVRRARAAQTRLRRLRGVVATELATSRPHDDARILVRRAALTIDSDLALLRRQRACRALIRFENIGDLIAEHCGATTPALRQAAQPLPLSDREREIITLLAQGLSTRNVTERLTLFTRTIEGHIYRAMAKTGTTNRNQLTALLTPHARPDD